MSKYIKYSLTALMFTLCFSGLVLASTPQDHFLTILKAHTLRNIDAHLNSNTSITLLSILHASSTIENGFQTKLIDLKNKIQGDTTVEEFNVDVNNLNELLNPPHGKGYSHPMYNTHI